LVAGGDDGDVLITGDLADGDLTAGDLTAGDAAAINQSINP